jgi:hypothetical protein
VADRAAAAESQFEKAVQIHRRYQAPFEEAETLYYWGRALNERDKYSDANEKFTAATEIYRRHGAGERWIDRVEQERTRPQSSRKIAHFQTASSASADENIFRKERRLLDRHASRKDFSSPQPERPGLHRLSSRESRRPHPRL